MKKYNTDWEKLSAYIDGELPLSEKNELEQKLSLSEGLRRKLEELRKIKGLTSNSAKQLPDSPYLETRIMANLMADGGRPLFKRKWVPVVSLIVVTGILMVILKLNPQLINRLVEEQSTNLAAFYKENLKPILYAANLSNEDIFNFAFYKELPLDNNNEQFLQIGNDPKGVEYFEIKKSSYNIQENNYERFVTALNLNEKQKHHVDSILQHYAGELQSQILVSDKNAVAINPNLWNYNRAIAADLVQFASQVNEPELRKLMPASEKYFSQKMVDRMVVEVKSNNENNYIFLTPDTIFTSWIDIDSKDMQREFNIAREELKKANRELHREIVQHNKEAQGEVRIRLDSLRHTKNRNYRKENFDVHVGDNSFRVEAGSIEIPEIPDMDSISAEIDKMVSRVQVFTTSSPKNPTKLSKRYNFQYSFKDSLKSVVVPDMNQIDSSMNLNYNYFLNNNKMIDSIVSQYLPNIIIDQDSLTTYFRMYDDSSKYIYQMELQNQLKEMEVEMKKFREEMQKLRMEINKDTNETERKRTIKKSVEI